jgi:type IV pilus assembly protein PilF
MSRFTQALRPSLRAAAQGAALAAAGLLLAACAGGPASLPADATDLRTASDLTNADRRASARLELASAYFARGQLATALDEVKLALSAMPDMPQGLNLRGLIYAAMGESKLAEESFRRARAVAPQDADTMHNFGWFLCQQGQYVEADAEFGRALGAAQYRAAGRTLLARGVCHARAGKWDEAEAALSKSYEIDPTSPATAYNLADVLYRRGEYQRARFYMRRVNGQAEQSNAQSLWLAARIEKRLGNLSGARDFGNQLRDRFPRSPEALQYERGRYDD